MNRAIFLDRDGTINIDKHYLNNPDDIEYVPKVFEALSEFSKLGFLLVVVTNQSGIPRGKITEEQLQSIHTQMRIDFKKHNLEIAGFYHSPHLPDSNDPMRKPNPGMLLKAAEDHGIELLNSWMIGDKISDVEAGLNAGCKSIFFSPEKIEHKAHFQSEKWLDVLNFILSQKGI